MPDRCGLNAVFTQRNPGTAAVCLDPGGVMATTSKPRSRAREAERVERGEVLRHFDSQRREFTPYGFTCEIWEPRRMPRPDRHDEIEINFLDRGTLTYLFGGQRMTVEARRVTAFWAAVPHQIVGFDKLNYYHVVTVPFGWVLQWGLPEHV